MARARRDASATFRFSTRGVAKTQRQLTRMEQELDKAIREEFKTLAPLVTMIFREASPSRRLARGIVPSSRSFTRQNPNIEILSTYRDPTSGFDPLGVSRFGHRRKRIYPRADRGNASVISTKARRGPERGTQTAIAFHSRGRLYFRHYVSGQDPARDWVKTARDQAEPLIREATGRLGRKIVSSIP